MSLLFRIFCLFFHGKKIRKIFPFNLSLSLPCHWQNWFTRSSLKCNLSNSSPLAWFKWPWNSIICLPQSKWPSANQSHEAQNCDFSFCAIVSKHDLSKPLSDIWYISSLRNRMSRSTGQHGQCNFVRNDNGLLSIQKGKLTWTTKGILSSKYYLPVQVWPFASAQAAKGQVCIRVNKRQIYPGNGEFQMRLNFNKSGLNTLHSPSNNCFVRFISLILLFYTHHSAARFTRTIKG